MSLLMQYCKAALSANPSLIPSQLQVVPVEKPGTDSGTKNCGAKVSSPCAAPQAIKAGILGMSLFFFITFISNLLLEHTNPSTLGIVVTLGTFGLLVFILFIVSLV